MALLWYEGFNSFSNEDDMASADGWDFVNASATPTFETGRWGHGSSVIWDSTLDTMIRSFEAAGPTIYASFAMKWKGYPNDTGYNTGSPLFFSTATTNDRETGIGLFMLLGSQKCTFVLGSSGNYPYLLVPADLPSFNHWRYHTWHWYDMRIKLSNTVGEVELYIDGEQVISETGLDTQQSGAVPTHVHFFNGGRGDGYVMDDLVIYDDTGSSFNTFPLNEAVIETLRPSANGFQNDFANVTGPSNWQDVDDASGGYSSATNVNSSTTTDIESYACTNLSTTYPTIHAVAPSICANVKGPVAAGRTFRQRIRSSASDALGADKTLSIPGSTNYAFHYKYEAVELDPNGSVAWTTAAVNAAEYGFELRT